MGRLQEFKRSVIVLVAMVMMVAASAAMAVLVMVPMIVIMRMLVVMMLMRVAMGMVVTMIVVMPVVVMVVIVITDMGAALRLERALHGHHGAALPAREFRKGRIVLDVESIIRDLGKAMVRAEMPSKTHETQRVLRLHLQQSLSLRLHLNEAAILQTQGIAVVDGGLHVKIEQDLGAALSLQRRLPAVSRLMVECHRVDDTVGLHGGLADDGGDAGHGFVSGECFK
jgi:hypothetical protein